VSSTGTAACPACRDGVITLHSKTIDGAYVCDNCFRRHAAGTLLVRRADRTVTESPPTINYTMTPQRFMLEIPVEALPALTNDAHTRMLAMLSDWIARHKPPVVRVKDPSPPSVERDPFDNGPLTK